MAQSKILTRGEGNGPLTPPAARRIEPERLMGQLHVPRRAVAAEEQSCWPPHSPATFHRRCCKPRLRGEPHGMGRARHAPRSNHRQTAKLQQPQRQPSHQRVWLVPINANYRRRVPPGARLMATAEQKELRGTAELDTWVRGSGLLFATRDWLGFGFRRCSQRPSAASGPAPF